MEKHLLVTVSEDSRLFYGLSFLTRFFSVKDGIRVTLFHIAPSVSAIWPEEMNYENITRRDAEMKLIEERGKAALVTAKKNLIKGGFSPDMVDTKMVFGGFAKHAVILQEGEYGLYDAVVLGQRGWDRLHLILEQSLSADMLRKTFTFPLWVCRLPGVGRQGVLICADGSEPSKRIADHAGFILSGERAHPVTLFTVIAPGKEAPGEDFFAAYRDIVCHGGFPAEMVTVKTVVSADPAKAILAEAEAGRHAAVAVGRTGAGRGPGKKIFFGSVSTSLFEALSGAVLWVSR